MEAWDVVVVGAGIAGVSAVRTIAERGGHRVLLLNEESAAPYKRTKGSKYIVDGFDPDRYSLEDPQWYEDHGVTLKNGCEVQSIAPEDHTVTLGDGETIQYKSLILAPGANPIYPKTVRPHEAGSFFTVRNAEDVQRLTAAAKKLAKGPKNARKVLIDGMGVLAVEVAAELNRMGLQVTLAGATPQLMPRQLSIRSAEILEELLTSRGVKLRFQEEILSFEPRKKGGFTVSMIRDSATFNMVIFCIGVAPRTRLAEDAGIDVGAGIKVDDYMQTSAPDVFAAGDAAEHKDGYVSQLWHAAEHQGRIAALNAIGEKTPFDNLPFRLKCEVFDSYFFSISKPSKPLDYGLDEMELDGRYQCFYFEGDSLYGAVMVNDRDRAKLYEQAVRERWSRERVRSEISLT